MRLFDSASGTVRPAAPGPVARMYVCGITPYDATHIGHAATYVAFDLLNRAWRDAGLEVRYVQNVTDVDDPLLERAEATGVDWQVLAKEQTDLFAGDMAALAVIPPDVYLGAVETIPLVVTAVQRLLDAGHAYRVTGAAGEPDGDVYFRVHADPHFGSVANLRESQMLEVFAERGGDPQRAGKQDPLDCLLWRVERPGEPSWDGGALGHGRPGWHIECTSIALEHLGMSFDVQGGGRGPGVPPPRDGRGRGAGADRQLAVRAQLRARRDGRAGRAQDEQVAREPGVRLPAAGARRSTPRRSGWPSSPTTTGRTGNGPTEGLQAACHRLLRGVRPRRYPGPPTRSRWSTTCGSGSPTTSTPPVHSTSSTPGRPTSWRTVDRHRHRHRPGRGSGGPADRAREPRDTSWSPSRWRRCSAFRCRAARAPGGARGSRGNPGAVQRPGWPPAVPPSSRRRR